MREMRAFLDDARFKKDANVGGGVADEGEGKRSARTRRWQVVRAVAMGDFGTLSASAFTRDEKPLSRRHEAFLDKIELKSSSLLLTNTLSFSVSLRFSLSRGCHLHDTRHTKTGVHVHSR